MTARTLNRYLNLPPIQWQALADRLTPDQRAELRTFAQCVAVRAAELAAYMEERQQHSGDQCHAAAVKNMNKVGRTVWCKAFGYADYFDLSF